MHQLEFKTLGQLTCLSHGETLSLGPNRQQCVLAALLVDADANVPLDTLVHRIWPEKLPRRPREILYTYVSRLRTIHEEVLILQTSGGYRLAIDPLAVDMHRFRRLTARVPKERDPSSDLRLLSAFEQALGLWHGTPFAGLNTTWLDEIRHQLESERLDVVLQYHDVALLHRNVDASLMESIRRFSEHHPLNERAAAQMVLALYKTGDQVAALTHYHDVKSRLAEDLGILPSPALQEIYHAILDQDSLLGPNLALLHPSYPKRVSASITTANALRVTNIAPRNPHFSGRASTLKEVHQTLGAGPSDQPSVVALYGLGGVGKTQIALEYAHANSDDYDVIWWINAENPLLVPGQFVELASQLGLALSASADGTLRRVLNNMADSGRWLLIFDNAQRPIDIFSLRPRGPGHIVVTSRFPAWGGLGARTEVLILDRADSVSLLRQRIGSIEYRVAHQIAAELGDLALALAQAAAYIEQTDLPPEDYIRRLRNGRRRKLLSQGMIDDYEAHVYTTWTISLARLRQKDPAAVELMELCALLGPDPIPLSLFEGSTFLPEALKESASHDSILDVVGSTVRYSLARRSGNSIQVHRLVQAVIRDETPLERRVTLGRSLIRMLQGASDVDPQVPSNWPMLSDLAGHALALGQLADNDAHGRQLLLATNSAFYYRGDSIAYRSISETIYQRWLPAFGEDHPDVILAASHLASAMIGVEVADGELAGLGEEALQRAYRVLGLEHPTTLKLELDLTFAMTWLGRFKDASILGSSSLVRSARVLGLAHPETLWLASIVAFAAVASGESDGIEQARRALRQANLSLGRSHPLTYTIALMVGLAEAYTWDDLHEGCVAELERTVAAAADVLGPRHHTTLALDCLNALTIALVGRYDEAAKRIHCTLDTAKESLGANHTITVCAEVVMSFAAEFRRTESSKPDIALVELQFARCNERLGEAHLVSLVAAMTLAKLLRVSNPERLADLTSQLDQRLLILGPKHPFRTNIKLEVLG